MAERPRASGIFDEISGKRFLAISRQKAGDSLSHMSLQIYASSARFA